MKADVAVIGTGVMGSNLARNLARSSGHRVAIYDHDVARAQSVATDFPEAEFIVASSPGDLAEKLTGPRVAILMVNAGRATDSAIADLAEVFAAGDIIVDGGNSHFQDTIARGRRLEGTGIEFAGVGISGGEVGALLGPSLMVGGSAAAWERLRPLLEPIAARAGDASAAGSELVADSASTGDSGSPCVAHIGTDGAGHFVKMVHNGIEYADMQLIAEAFTLLRDGLGMAPTEIAEVFERWNDSELESYLIEITADVLAHVDAATGSAFVDIVADAAKAKGTGAWTAQVGLDLGVPVPTVAEAVFSRSLSSAVVLRAEGRKLAGPRPHAAGILCGTEFDDVSADIRVSPSPDGDECAAQIDEIGRALLLGKVMAYVQGFHEISAGAREYGWEVDLGDLASIWRAGCIIRARLLDRIVDAYSAETGPATLLADGYVRDVAGRCQDALRSTVIRAMGRGIPVPGLASTLAYYDGLRAEAGSAALIQAQRDRFGSHTYARNDRPGVFHTLWSGDRSEVEV
ncbi:NADP-dependent phosphogluconate dehydrogenase [Brevibacterium atlanticum]|uniref:NADP-dependent phosphogluconate dehydrogenase n=1 Tax=Brevibacterium atlanticum TaxID=2697563 RepID=UPI001421243F|nr:NADP-dependent phosphogluconate dehydrogenase [Brevibacterium atlanticum]